MSLQFNLIKQPRLTLLKQIEPLSLEQLNNIPAGFNNNIIWNLGHMIAAQSGICYKRANVALPAGVNETFFETYKPGTKPERLYTTDEVEEIKTLLISSLDQLEADLQTDIFNNYPTWTTRYGAELHSINDAVSFLPFHEGLHIGAIIALRKMIVI